MNFVQQMSNIGLINIKKLISQINKKFRRYLGSKETK